MEVSEMMAHSQCFWNSHGVLLL